MQPGRDAVSGVLLGLTFDLFTLFRRSLRLASVRTSCVVLKTAKRACFCLPGGAAYKSETAHFTKFLRRRFLEKMHLIGF